MSSSDNPKWWPISCTLCAAQLNAPQNEDVFSKAEENELLFQDIALAGRSSRSTSIDVLSSTTTMEVGIDIGALSGVALRNMPPGGANYQQRFGRAGRRGNAVATVVAFGSADSHGEHYFIEPDGMIRGDVVDPKLKAFRDLVQANGGHLFLCDPRDLAQLGARFAEIGTQARLRAEGDTAGAQRLLEHLQAVPFEFEVGTQVPSGRARDGRFRLDLANGERASARTVVIASGVRYRRPAIEGLAAFEGTSVHYWASPLEAKLCAGQEVALVGAGNSAGQAVVYLASQVKKVWLLVRGPSLAAKMSRYLVDRITGLTNVEVLTETNIAALDGGDGILEAVRWRAGSGEETRRPLRHVFLFIGGDPNTDWVKGSGTVLDRKGFVLTGSEADARSRPLETSVRGVFAIGDVRAGSTKRVAAAVGEGAQVVATLHAFLAEAEQRPGEVLQKESA
jgi:thioredoxin reductase